MLNINATALNLADRINAINTVDEFIDTVFTVGGNPLTEETGLAILNFFRRVIITEDEAMKLVRTIEDADDIVGLIEICCILRNENSDKLLEALANI